MHRIDTYEESNIRSSGRLKHASVAVNYCGTICDAAKRDTANREFYSNNHEHVP